MAALFSAWSTPLSAATVSWINPAGGNWSVGSNWSGGVAPAVDDVVIDLAGTYTVRIDVPATVASITLGSGSGTETLAIPTNQSLVVNGPGASNVSGGGILSLAGGLGGAGSITVASTVNWSAGGMINGLHIGTMTVAAGGALNLTGTGVESNKRLEGWTINNAGTITSSGDENITINNGATINNLVGGRFLITSNPSYNYGGNGPVPQFNNSGTLTKTSPGAFVIRRFDFVLNNDGTVELPGVIGLSGGGASSGAYNVTGALGFSSKTGTIGFPTRTYIFSPGASINGTGTIFVGNGGLVDMEGSCNVALINVGTDESSLTLGGTVTSLQKILLFGGRLDLNTTASIPFFDFLGGTLGGSGALTLPLNGFINWSGGAIDGTGSIIIPAGSTRSALNIMSTGTKSISQRTINNAGTITSSGTGAITIGGGATINNQSGGKYLIQTDAPYNYGSGAIPQFNNSGTLTKSGGTATTPFGFALTNSGTIGLQTGILAVSNGYTQTGVPATLNLTVAGLTPGTQFAKLAVTGTAALAGTLSISTGAYVPNDGDTFQIMTFDSRSGDFTTKNYTYPGGVFTDSYGAGALTLTAHTAGMEPAEVSGFTASPSTIVDGDSATLSWTTLHATGVTIDHGVGAQSANGSVNVSPATTTFYTLTTNAPGKSATATVTVTVKPRDAVPPTTSASPMPAPNGAGWNNSSVTVTFTATDNTGGSGVESITTSINAAAPTTVSGATASLVLSDDGVYSIAYHATDKAGNVEADNTLTLRIDKTAPAATLTLSPSLLWPPNHKFVAITATLNATDSGGRPVTVTGPLVTSSEPISGGSDDTSPDWIVSESGLQLRAERSGEGTGRVYTITYVVTDQAGNTTNARATVTVPHDQGR